MYNASIYIYIHYAYHYISIHTHPVTSSDIHPDYIRTFILNMQSDIMETDIDFGMLIPHMKTVMMT